MAPLSSVIDRAFRKRLKLLNDSTTNVYRLIDGGGDGLPGITLESFAGVWLVSTLGTLLPEGFREPLKEGVRAVYWKCLDQGKKEAPVLVSGEDCDAPFLVQENGMVFEVSMTSGYSQGIFLDQRENRARVRANVREGQRVLNTFSYTSAFSIAAALGGAVTTSLDLSNPYLAWGRRNFEANGLDPDEHFFCRGDAMSWMGRFAKKDRRFSGVILDPPTFSRSEAGVFRAQKDYDRLVEAAVLVTEPGGWVLATCNDRGLTHARFEELVRGGIRRAGRRMMDLADTGMPVDFTGEDYLKSVWATVA